MKSWQGLRRFGRDAAFVALGALITAIAAFGQDRTSRPAAATTTTTPVETVRATGVGLPQIGAKATVAVGDLPNLMNQYYDSGQYEADLEAVDAKAKTYLAKRLDQLSRPVKHCYKKRKDSKGRRRCRLFSPPKVKPAIVFDIDETSLSNYVGLRALGFLTAGGFLITGATGTGSTIKPTLELFNYARAHGVDVFFVSGRPKALQGITEDNLRAAGYEGWKGISVKPGGTATSPYKTGERAKIEEKGYTIIANVGDQESDLAGGHAERAFKLPNPFYFIP